MLDKLTEKGFIFEALPSGRYNICHKECFYLNDIKATRGRGQWFRTLEIKNLHEISTYIKSAKLIADFI